MGVPIPQPPQPAGLLRRPKPGQPFPLDIQALRRQGITRQGSSPFDTQRGGWRLPPPPGGPRGPDTMASAIDPLPDPNPDGGPDPDPGPNPGPGPSPPTPPTPPGPLDITFLPGLLRAFGILGGGAEQRFTDILNSIQTKPYLQGLIQDGALEFGVPNLPGLLAVVQNPHRQQFIQQIIDAARGDGGPPDGGGPPGGGGPHGGGGPGPDFGAFGMFGEGIMDLSTIPNFQLINDTLAEFLSGDRPFEPLDIEDPLGNLRGATEGSILDLLQAEGLPQDVIDAAENTISARVKAAQSDALRRSNDVFAGRGLGTGLGLAERSRRDIGEGFTEILANQLSDLGLQNAMQAAQQRQIGLSGALGLGNLGLGAQQLGIQGGLGARAQDLQALSTALGGLLGMGDLGIRNIQTDLQRQLEEFRLGILANALFGAGGGGGGGSGFVPTFDFSQLLNGGFFGDGPGFFTNPPNP